MENSNAFIQTQLDSCKNNEELADLWRQAQDFYSRKLWHQITVVLLKLFNRPETKSNLTEIYQNVVKDLEPKLNTISLAQMANMAANEMSEREKIEAFYKRVIESMSAAEDAGTLLRINQGVIYLNKFNDLPAGKKLMEESEILMDKMDFVAVIHKDFYSLCSEYYKRSGDHAKYYQSSLRFLGCSNLDERSDAENTSIAIHLALAALLGKDIFNFGELLAHPVLEFLQKSSENWLVDVLLAFNSGNVTKFRELKPQWEKQNDLKANQEVLYEKICLLTVMEMTFKREATDRLLTFDDVAQETGLPVDKVELLVMKALSRDLIRGTIDQVERTVNVGWVQPRVLDKKQVETLKGKLESWCKSIVGMEKMIEDNASEILTN